MSNNNDIQLFYSLIDSLSTSLRELVVKYELIAASNTRTSGEQDKINNVLRDINASITGISKEVDNLKESVDASKNKQEGIFNSISIINKTLSDIDSKIVNLTKTVETNYALSKENKDVTLHIDGHMDDFNNKINLINNTFEKLESVTESINEIKSQIEPIKKLAVVIHKPIAFVIGVYMIITIILTAIKGCEQFDGHVEKTTKIIKQDVTNNKEK